MTRRRTTRNSPYKRKRRTTQRANTSPVKWLLSGIFIGLIIPSYFLLKHPSAPKTYAATEQTVIAAESHELTKKVVKKPTPKEESKEPTQAKYEFYNLLSSEEDSSKNDETTIQNQYILKVAALKTFEEADQLKAQLSLIGMEHILINKSSSSSRYPYKVTIGPFSSRTEALKIKKELQDNNISGEIVEN